MQRTQPVKKTTSTATAVRKPATGSMTAPKKASAAPSKTSTSKATPASKPVVAKKPLSPPVAVLTAQKPEESKIIEAPAKAAPVDPSDTSKWEHIGLKAVMRSVEMAHKEQKYSLIQDLQGNAARFFQYSANLCELDGDLKKLNFKMNQASDITEKMRAAMVVSMRSGSCVCYNFEDMDVCPRDFNDETNLPFDTFFDWQKGRDHATYNTIVREDEKWDMVARVVDGHFFMQDGFNIVVLTKSEDPEVIKKIVNSFPHEKMAKFVIE